MKNKNDHLPDLFQQDLEDVMKVVDSFFGDAFKKLDHYIQTTTIPIEVVETDKEYTIEAYLPGVKREQIHLEHVGSQVRIRVEGSEDRYVHDHSMNYFNQSRSFTRKERIIPLPFTVSDTVFRASFQDGLLTILFKKQGSSIIPIED
ncbi:UNVERIFIED_CONTAM: Hsp20/alpha crystallin family protein [Halobacillus marinus]